jgi:general stress protein YciG
MADSTKPTTPKAPKAAKVEGEMSVREAGKKGGDTVRDRYGSGFYETIGRKGGQATRERHGAEFYESIGQKGGQKVKKLIADAKATAAAEEAKKAENS